MCSVHSKRGTDGGSAERIYTASAVFLRYFLLYVSQISRGVGNSVAAYTFVTDWILNELWNNLRLSILSVRRGARVLYASSVCSECVYVLRSILVLLGLGRNITPECIVIIHVVRLCVLHTGAARLPAAVHFYRHHTNHRNSRKQCNNKILFLCKWN